jgi:uncharacterized protein YdeI (YjbR/CyaY-like superfamily)
MLMKKTRNHCAKCDLPRSSEIDEKLILNYIKEAIEIEEKGLVIPKEKKETIIPELLQNELDKNQLTLNNQIQ